MNVGKLHRQIRGLKPEQVKLDISLDETLELILSETEKLVKQNQLVVENSVRSLRISKPLKASSASAPSSKASPKTAVLGKTKKIRRRGKKVEAVSSVIPPVPSGPVLPSPSLEDLQKDGLTITLPLSNSCPHCSQRDKDEWCIRTVEVERVEGDYKGCVLTEAPEHDRLRPKVSAEICASSLS